MENEIMSFTLIKGTFHVKGYSPDGDSIRFRAKDPTNWKKLSGPAVGLNALGHAQLRIEAIDALETHFGGMHQPLRYARSAARYLLSSLGIHEVVWDETQSFVVKAEDGTKGFILARSTEKNRRPVAFVFAGETEFADGEGVQLDARLLKQSLNYKSVAKGLAYPTYYNGLFSDLREAFTQAVISARAEDKGIWPSDRTTKGFSVADIKLLTEQIVIMPKLFRRIIEYMGNGGKIDEFMDHLLKGCEPLVKIPEVNFSRFDSIVEIKEDRLRLTVAPERLIFLDKVLCQQS
ncbi:MAG: thermonuclease family protein [Methanothrix sp.]|nr:thermonuclease family protein [Methanothrix sp.]